jgi:hypothetical protein
MFIRIKAPDQNQSTTYLVMKEFNFSRTSSFDVYHISQIFSQSPILIMIMGSQVHFTVSGNLFVKSSGSGYNLDGLYDAGFNLVYFSTTAEIAKYFNQWTNVWNNGIANINTKSFIIEYVNNYNDASPTYFENFLPESFSYSIANRDSMVVNVSVSGVIGQAM